MVDFIVKKRLKWEDLRAKDLNAFENPQTSKKAEIRIDLGNAEAKDYRRYQNPLQ